MGNDPAVDLILRTITAMRCATYTTNLSQGVHMDLREHERMFASSDTAVPLMVVIMSEDISLEDFRACVRIYGADYNEVVMRASLFGFSLDDPDYYAPWAPGKGARRIVDAVESAHDEYADEMDDNPHLGMHLFLGVMRYWLADFSEAYEHLNVCGLDGDTDPLMNAIVNRVEPAWKRVGA